MVTTTTGVGNVVQLSQKPQISRSQTPIPKDLMHLVHGCLEPQGLACMKGVNRDFERSVVDYLSQWNLLREKIGTLSSQTDAKEFSQLFSTFLCSPYFPQLSGNMRKSILDLFWEARIPQEKSPLNDLFITSFDCFVDAINSSKKKPACFNLRLFCVYLVDKLESSQVWVVYRILEKFVAFAPEEVTKILSTFLNNQAFLGSFPGSMFRHGNFVQFDGLRIDPGKWFGSNESNHSLWKNYDKNDDSAPIPLLMNQILFNYIYRVKKSLLGCRPVSLFLLKNTKAIPPKNFSLPLVKQVSDHEIFVDHGNTVDTEQLHPFYARSRGIVDLNGEELSKLLESFKTSK